MNTTYAYELFYVLSTEYASTSAIRRLILKKSLFDTKFSDGGDLCAHITHIESMLHELKAMTHPMDDEDAAIVLLSSLPQSWETFCSTTLLLAGTTTLSFAKVIVVEVVKGQR